MNKFITGVFLLAGGMILSGCGPKVSQRPTAQLCTEYMTLPSANIWQSERAAELARRGADCNPYIGIAAARREADRDLQSTLNAIANTGSGVNTVNTLPTMPATRTYILNGRHVTCTSTGTVTNCN